MDYSAVKDYGECIRNLAIVFLESGNMYDGAKAMLEFGDKYYMYSRLTFKLLYDDDSYPGNQKLVTTLFDEYVSSDEVRRAFLSKLFINDDLQIAFIRRDLDNAYTMLCNIQMLLQAFNITAHPELHSEGQVITAIEKYIKPVNEDTKKNEDRFRLAHFTITAKENLRTYVKLLEDAIEQDKTKEHDKGPETQTQETEPQETAKDQHGQHTQLTNQIISKYDIANNELLLKIHEFLVKTDVLYSKVEFPDFISMTVNADASHITPHKKWKFITSLGYVATCIKEEQRTAWSRNICESIGRGTSDLTRNANRDLGWLEEINNVVEKYNRKSF